MGNDQLPPESAMGDTPNLSLNQLGWSIVNSLSSQIAVLNANGMIIAVNRAWRDSASANAAIENTCEGMNYLSVCDAAQGEGADEARAFAAGMRAVMRGEQPTFALEYPCHSPTEQRWFVGRVTQLDDRQPIRLLVEHTMTTDRKHLETALRQHEWQYQTLLEQASDAIFVSNPEGRFIDANPRASELTGYTRDELLALTGAELADPVELSQRPLRYETLQDGREALVERRLRRKDGTMVDVEISSRRLDNGMLIGITRDISARKRAEQMQQFLDHTSQVLLEAFDYDARLHGLAQLCVPILADCCSVHLMQDDDQLGLVDFAATTPEQFALLQQSHERYPFNPKREIGLAQVFRTGEIQFLPEIPSPIWETYIQDAEHQALVRQLNIGSAMLLPLQARGRILGVIALYMADSNRRYTSDDLVVAKELARRAAISIDNAHLYRQTQEQREQLRVTLSSIGDGVIATNAEGQVTFMNPVAESLIGWAQAEAAGQAIEKVFNICNEETRQTAENPVMRVLREGRVVGLANHTALISRDGTHRAIDDSGAPIRDETGQLIGAVLVFRDITAQRQIEAQLEEERSLLRTLLDIVPDYIYIRDREGRFILNNAEHRRVMGAPSPESVIGKTDFDFFPRVLAEQYWADDQWVMNSRQPLINREERTVDPAGHKEWVITSKVPLQDRQGKVMGLVGISRDITGRKKAEERLARLQTITEAFSKALTPSEVANVVLSQGLPAIGAAAGYLTRLADHGKMLEILYAAGYEAAVLQQWQRFPIAVRTPISDAVQQRTPIWIASPEERHVRYPALPVVDDRMAWAAVPLIADEQTIGALGLSFAEVQTFGEEDRAFILMLAQQCAQAVDRASLYAELQAHAALLEQTVEARTAELKNALARVESADRAKTRMLSNVSHEMRTPLSSIVGFSGLILDREVSRDKLREYTQFINNEGRRLTRLVNEFLDLQRIESGKEIFKFTHTNMAALLRAVIDTYEFGEQPQHAIRLELASVQPAWADQERIRQVVLNLLSNSLKYSPEGGEIIVLLRQEGNEVITSIHDQGIGIAPEEAPYLFERFQRGEQAEHLRIQGTGLGLALCKEIISHHNGRIWAESAGAGHGAIFHFALPVSS